MGLAGRSADGRGVACGAGGRAPPPAPPAAARQALFGARGAVSVPAAVEDADEADLSRSAGEGMVANPPLGKCSLEQAAPPMATVDGRTSITAQSSRDLGRMCPA